VAEERAQGREGAVPGVGETADEQEGRATRSDPEEVPADGVEQGPPGGRETEPGDAAGEAAPPAGDEGGAPAGEAGDDPARLRALLEEETKKSQEYYDRLLRLMADFENYKRRTRQEMENFYKYSSEQIIRALLPVLDNFERALAAEGGSLESYKSGIEMIYRQLMEVLAGEGLAPVEAAGEPFDPARHEAVLQEETAGYEDNTVIEVLRRGYYLKDKVIRPAMVKVARAPRGESP